MITRDEFIKFLESHPKKFVLIVVDGFHSIILYHSIEHNADIKVYEDGFYFRYDTDDCVECFYFNVVIIDDHIYTKVF